MPYPHQIKTPIHLYHARKIPILHLPLKKQLPTAEPPRWGNYSGASVAGSTTVMATMVLHMSPTGCRKGTEGKVSADVLTFAWP